MTYLASELKADRVAEIIHPLIDPLMRRAERDGALSPDDQHRLAQAFGVAEALVGQDHGAPAERIHGNGVPQDHDELRTNARHAFERKTAVKLGYL